MNIFTMYCLNVDTLLNTFDVLAYNKGGVKVLATDPKRLYNDAQHEDVSMASITFECTGSAEEVRTFFNRNDVFVCEEDPKDWE